MQSRLTNVGNAFLALISLACLTRAQAAFGAPPAPRYSVTGPYVHDNLSVFLIHGPDTLKDRNYLTLAEALQNKTVVVYETGNVNELAIENLSPSREVYIQSGDIVKGGRQDRTIAIDLVVPAHSGKMPIDAFCVESGRWQQRGTEASTQFAVSENALSGKDLKLAARKSGNQGEVWDLVAARQAKLASNAGQSVADNASQSSFELSLESKPVQDHADAYVKSLQALPDRKDDVIGYAFAINGKINSVDVYASHGLFMKLWPRLLKSSAIEAFADLEAKKTFAPATVADVNRCIADARGGKETIRQVNPRIQLVTQETEANVVYRCIDRGAAPDAAVHENFVSKK